MAVHKLNCNGINMVSVNEVLINWCAGNTANNGASNQPYKRLDSIQHPMNNSENTKHMRTIACSKINK